MWAGRCSTEQAGVHGNPGWAGQGSALSVLIANTFYVTVGEMCDMEDAVELVREMGFTLSRAEVSSLLVQSEGDITRMVDLILQTQSTSNKNKGINHFSRPLVSVLNQGKHFIKEFSALLFSS